MLETLPVRPVTVDLSIVIMLLAVLRSLYRDAMVLSAPASAIPREEIEETFDAIWPYAEERLAWREEI